MRGRRRLLAGLLAIAALASCGDGAYDAPALASVQPPTVRVLLGRRRNAGRLRLAAQAWSITGGAGYARRGSAAVDVRIEPGEHGIRVGGEETRTQDLRVQVAREFELEGTRYAGDLLLHQRDGRIRFVNEVDMETYVAGVIPNEMAPNAAPAAYQAQSVAVRTYAWIRVTDQGSILFEGMMQPGQSYTVPPSASAPLLRAGAPEALRVTVGDTVAPPVGPAGQVTSNVSLKPADLLRPKAASGGGASPAQNSLAQ